MQSEKIDQSENTIKDLNNSNNHLKNEKNDNQSLQNTFVAKPEKWKAINALLEMQGLSTVSVQ